ncbi:NAD(P)/FAD-dependent oxidoreductase [Neosynechococcus sphagnicola]|uniref:NAD(P)/FAD-dependent oxidoreductase n=1 Tax=Neosynechococcus sphagnicola TaxID=1501145 RepID=UPI0009E04B4D|nr:flavin-dependent dehydrogenase [Neosynechococcus sphagnicola]
MREIYYAEVPTPDTHRVKVWLQQEFDPGWGHKTVTPTGIRLGLTGESTPSTTDNPRISETAASLPAALVLFIWSVQRTTYLKVFRWTKRPFPEESLIIGRLTTQIQAHFPQQYPAPPEVDLSQQSIFEALAPHYPQTVRYFQKMPNGEYDLNRVYWWEQRWREGVRHPQQPKQVVFSAGESTTSLQAPDYDLIYIGGALGVLHAAVMARLGYRVLLVERLPFGRMNREWNISRQEFQNLIDLGLLTPAEFEGVIAHEYLDGFHKFFDANNPPQAKAPVLHTPTVLNIALNAEKLLRLCGEKLREAGGQIWDQTEFTRVEIGSDRATVFAQFLPSQAPRQATARLVVDAMGTASAIAWQLNGGRTFDSVCPTVGAVIADGFEPGVWDRRYGDVLNSHGDISRGRQLIWELFPGEDTELTIYLFHYHQVHPENPGSLLEMYEDFFTILPEYRRCNAEDLVWKKPTFGYIPGHFSHNSRDRQVAFDRLIAIGDAASLQSPLVFTGFGSLVRNLGRLTHLLDTALRHDLLDKSHLNQIRAYQSNVAVTWLFSKGMMVPTGQFIPPQRINAMLNTFFGILASESPTVAESFIKDRTDWLTFNRMALKAAWHNPALLWWIWQLAGPSDLWRWLGSYLNFTLLAFLGGVCSQWLPRWIGQIQPWVEPRYPGLWFWLLSQSYALTYGTGIPCPYMSSLKPLLEKDSELHAENLTII